MAALGSLKSQKASAFGAYSRGLEARGLKGQRALMAVMRKMLVVAYHLLKSGEQYDPAKVWGGTLEAGVRHEQRLSRNSKRSVEPPEGSAPRPVPCRL